MSDQADDLAEAIRLLRLSEEPKISVLEYQSWASARNRLLAKYPEAPKLLPCPFCGEKAETSRMIDGCWIIRCLECDSRSFGRHELKNAIVAWNRRATS